MDFYKNLGINALNDVDNLIYFVFVFIVIVHHTSNTLWMFIYGFKNVSFDVVWSGTIWHVIQINHTCW